MPRMRLAWPALIIGFSLLAHAGPAQAQLINPFGVYNGNMLSKDDYAMGRAAAQKLLNEPPAVGRYEDWSNAATGNHGRLTIIDILTQNNMPCRKVSSRIVFSKKGSAPTTLVLDVCKTPSGWKIAS